MLVGEDIRAVDAHAPVRRRRILELAKDIRRTVDPLQIEEVAERQSILLIRTNGPHHREAGFAYVEKMRRPMYIESLANPAESLAVWGEERWELVRSIVLNTNSGIPEYEIFWHEYYHIHFSSDSLQRGERFEHHFSTEGALHSQEERRADEFAVAVLIPSLEETATIPEIIERFGVSERLANRAVQFYSALHELP